MKHLGQRPISGTFNSVLHNLVKSPGNWHQTLEIASEVIMDCELCGCSDTESVETKETIKGNLHFRPLSSNMEVICFLLGNLLRMLPTYKFTVYTYVT